MTMAVGGKEAAAILPKPRPNTFAVSIGQTQSIERVAAEKLKSAFTHGGRSFTQTRLEFEEEHEPMRLSVKTVFTHEAREVKIAERKLQAHFLESFPARASVGRLSFFGVQFTAG